MRALTRLVALSLLLASPLVHASHHPVRVVRPARHPSLAAVVPPAPAPDAGAQLQRVPETISLLVAPSFFDQHVTLVAHDLLLFHESMIGIDPSLPNPNATADVPALSFVKLAPTDDLLELARQRDRLLLFRAPQPAGPSLAAGLTMFAVSTVASAHAPHAMRFLFDKTVHLGPAVFDAGGMGMGVGGALPH